MRILRDKNLKIIIIASAAIFLLSFIIASVKFIPWDGPVIIHFDAYKGIDIVKSKGAVFGALLSSLAILFVNFIISEFIYSRERFLSYIFSATGLIFSILVLIFIGVLVSVN